jgi:hypothetical protein
MDAPIRYTVTPGNLGDATSFTDYLCGSLAQMRFSHPGVVTHHFEAVDTVQQYDHGTSNNQCIDFRKPLIVKQAYCSYTLNLGETNNARPLQL